MSVAAAVRVAESLGVRVGTPVHLRSTNNVVVWLRPSPVVAKIGVGRRPGFFLEVDVARELDALGAPIVPLAPGLPARVHAQDAFEVSFWQYCPQPDAADIPPGQLASALHLLHSKCAQMSETLTRRLPHYRVELQSVSELLHDAERLSALPERDRRFLIRVFDQLCDRLAVLPSADARAVIHGSSHEHNVLLSDGEPRFIDFETLCKGPIEWDLAYTPPDTAKHYAGAVNSELLEVCRDLARVNTAAWCWSDVDRGDLREHAEGHLAYLKTTFDDPVGR